MDSTGKLYCAWCGGPLERKLAQGNIVCAARAVEGFPMKIPLPEWLVLFFLRLEKFCWGEEPAETMEGKWCIPCGHVEYNEDIRQALVREMWEKPGSGSIRSLCIQRIPIFMNRRRIQRESGF